jgi:hypothetical protein
MEKDYSGCFDVRGGFAEASGAETKGEKRKRGFLLALNMFLTSEASSALFDTLDSF